jgi:hypothetical protein
MNQMILRLDSIHEVYWDVYSGCFTAKVDHYLYENNLFVGVNRPAHNNKGLKQVYGKIYKEIKNDNSLIINIHHFEKLPDEIGTNIYLQDSIFYQQNKLKLETTYKKGVIENETYVEETDEVIYSSDTIWFMTDSTVYLYGENNQLESKIHYKVNYVWEVENYITRSVYVPEEKTEYLYQSDSVLIQETYFEYNTSSEWVPKNKMSYSVDKKNRHSLMYMYSWNTEVKQWTQDYYDQYKYDEQNRLKTILRYQHSFKRSDKMELVEKCEWVYIDSKNMELMLLGSRDFDFNNDNNLPIKSITWYGGHHKKGSWNESYGWKYYYSTVE